MPTVNLETARRVIEAAEAKAKTIGCPMNIAVVDVGGNLVAHARMDNARIGAIDIAINKAWTARAFDMETAELGRLSQPGAPFFGIHASNNGRVMILAGGAPLRDADQIIGAIGVSGGPTNRTPHAPAPESKRSAPPETNEQRSDETAPGAPVRCFRKAFLASSPRGRWMMDASSAYCGSRQHGT